jgi:hypothetical protein
MQRLMRRVGEHADALVERLAADDKRRRVQRQAESPPRDGTGQADEA